MSNFAECFALTLKWEGGFVNDPHDPGGATNHGITIATLSAYLGRPAKVDEVRHMTVDTAQRIYRLNYWDRIKGDQLPAGVDFAVYDFAVNSGVKRGIIGLQRALVIADDGKIGAITLEAARTCNPRTLLQGITGDRLAMLMKLSTWPRYGKGWTTRVTGVHKSAVAMIEHSKGHGQ